MKRSFLCSVALLVATGAGAQTSYSVQHEETPPTQAPSSMFSVEQDPLEPTASPEPTPMPTYTSPVLEGETIAPSTSYPESPIQSPPPPAPAREIPVARAQPANVLEVTARIQIFLDQKHFGPGKIDGAPGEFTSKALARYQRANGMEVTGDLADAHLLPIDEVHPIYTTYTIREEDLKRVGNVPKEPKDQAKLKSMPYPSILKFLQERFHSDPNFLRYLNPGRDLMALQAGDEVRVPNVRPFKIEEVKAVAKTPVNEAFKKNRRIEINTREKMLDLYENNELLASFPITPGSSKLPAPAGRWRIAGIATMPWFRYDEGVLKRGVRTDDFFNIPAGPSNPVGVVWMALNKRSIGLHGTNNPQTIGRAASHGCIRLANWDAIRLANMVSPGVSVTIDGDLLDPPASQQATTSPGNNGALVRGEGDARATQR